MTKVQKLSLNMKYDAIAEALRNWIGAQFDGSRSHMAAALEEFEYAGKVIKVDRKQAEYLITAFSEIGDWDGVVNTAASERHVQMMLGKLRAFVRG